VADSSETLKLILDLQIQSMGQQVLNGVAQSFEGLAAKAASCFNGAVVVEPRKPTGVNLTAGFYSRYSSGS
jgi:hypothetical protein